MRFTLSLMVVLNLFKSLSSFDDTNHEDIYLCLLSKSSYGPRWRDACGVSVHCIHRTPGEEMGLDNATDLENYMLI